jgi:general secretion pathway protein B
MSYILDALRKADAQRGQGAVPGLHTQPLAGAAASHATARLGPGSNVLLLGAATALLLAGVLGWRALSPAPLPATATDSPTGPAPSPRSAAPTRALPPIPAPAGPPLAPPSRPMAPLASPMTPPERQAGPPPAPPRAQDIQSPERRAATATSAGIAKGAGTASPPVAAVSPAASTAAAAPRLYKFDELPPEIRQQLPTLSVGGAMHSENASSRMLILGGQLYREGEQPSPGLTLERIQLRSAVFAFKGYRYEIGY